MPTTRQANLDFDVVVVGGGLAGLACLRRLCAAGFSCRLFESSERVGGRVATDEVDGFLLDRGFQVFLTAYPDAQAVLNYPQLELREFEPGALVRFQGNFHRLSDPWRRPRHLWSTAFSPLATLPDKMRIANFRRQATRGSLEDIYLRPEKPTIDFLHELGFTNVVIDRFFRPFFGGVFLDQDLQTSSRMCEFVFRMFSIGNATIPAHGMRRIPEQLADGLPPNAVVTNCPVEAIGDGAVILGSGERVTASAVVLATEAPVARTMLGDGRVTEGRSVSCFYFAAPQAPISEPILILNGEGSGPINNLCFPSQVAPHYAPNGQTLVSLTVLGQHAASETLLAQVKQQLNAWFGPSVNAWKHLRTYDIPYALPDQSPPALEPVVKPTRVRDGLFICGDHCDTASINGALASGLRAAEAVMSCLKR